MVVELQLDWVKGFRNILGGLDTGERLGRDFGIDIVFGSG